MEASLKPKYTSLILCPHCKTKFEVGRIQGEWLNRSCPECGGSLSSKEFDRYATKLLDEQAVNKSKEHYEKDCTRRHESIAKLIRNPLLKPLCFLLRANARRHQKASDKARSQKDAVTVVIDQAAMSRYYASEWFLSSGYTLQGDGNEYGPYALAAKYGRSGRPYLKQVKGAAFVGGIVGEWTVFETILAHIQNSEGLSGVRLVPNVFITSEKPEIEGLADQTDLLILARQAAFVCEVKNWRTHIRVQRDQSDVIIKTYENTEKNKQDNHESDKPIRQIRQRMESLAALGSYPKDRIYGLVVFVNPASFECSLKGFFKKVTVATCLSNGLGTLLPAIEEKLGQKDEVLTQEDLDAFANKLFASWVDRDGNIERQQKKLRDNDYGARRQERLANLADFAINCRQAGFQKREEHGKSRDATKNAQHSKSKKLERKQRHARKQRMYEIEQEFDEWDYLAS